MTGVLAEKIGAAIVHLEHRYYSKSSPFSDLTTANLTHLTLSNVISDGTNFANNVHLPFVQNGTKSNAADVPWVLIGLSYAGNVAAWTASVQPGTFWAYHASSAPVQAILDYWQYWLPVQKGMPANCSKDVSLVIDFMDKIWANGTTEEKEDLKAKFGMTGREPYDVGVALATAPSRWQGIALANKFHPFYRWCDYIENALTTFNGTVKYPTNFTAGPEGVGLQKALQGYATWFKTWKLPGFCEKSFKYYEGRYNTECFDNMNASNPMFKDISVRNQAKRQWKWLLCNEPFGAWQNGAPSNRPSLVSRTMTLENKLRMCDHYFPPGPNGETYGLARGKTAEQVNLYTGGWNLAANTTRVSFANGEHDPWIHESVSSDFRPGGPLASSKQAPVFMVPGGFHGTEMLSANSRVNNGVKVVRDQIVQQLAEWVAEWPGYARNHSMATD